MDDARLEVQTPCGNVTMGPPVTGGPSAVYEAVGGVLEDVRHGPEYVYVLLESLPPQGGILSDSRLGLVHRC
jgi:hypothetical protein